MGDDQGHGLREQKRLETWRAIRAAAVRSFGARGYDAVGVEDVAAAARVAKRTLFNHFATKEALVFDPDPEEPRRWARVLAARRDDGPIWVWLRDVCAGYAAEREAVLITVKALLTGSPSLARTHRTADDGFLAFLGERTGEHVAARGGHALHAVLLTNAAGAVLRTAFTVWAPPDGFGRYLELLDEGFGAIGMGFLPAGTGTVFPWRNSTG